MSMMHSFKSLFSLGLVRTFFLLVFFAFSASSNMGANIASGIHAINDANIGDCSDCALQDMLNNKFNEIPEVDLNKAGECKPSQSLGSGGPIEAGNLNRMLQGNVTTDKNGAKAIEVTLNSERSGQSGGTTQINQVALVKAIAYWEKNKDKLPNPRYITIVDYSKNSDEERFFVIDVEKGAVVWAEKVAHGSGSNGANKNEVGKLCNIPESKASVGGFLITGDTYQGKNGESLRIAGMEEGLNDKTCDRAVVIHSADYVTQNQAGNSHGCPALDTLITDEVIEMIKGGSAVYHHWDPEKQKQCEGQ